MKECSKCGSKNADTAVFCMDCGNELKGTADSAQIKTPANKKTALVVIGAVISVLLVVCIAVFSVQLLLSKYTAANQLPNSLIQANMTSWGYAAYDGENTYFSDGASGIYILKENGKKELFTAGKYSDMGILNGTIYCIEYQQTENEFKDSNVIVGINIESREKHTAFEPSQADMVLISVNVINSKYYFVADRDVLYSIDVEGKVENTGIHCAKKVSESGIYTAETSEYGLRLLSFDGKAVKTYSGLSGYKVEVCFEQDGFIYLKYSDDSSEKVYRMSMDTGELTLFPDDESFFEGNISSCVNCFDGTFYISTSKMSDERNYYGRFDYNVYSMDSGGGNIKKIYSKTDDTGFSFCTINIANNNLIISFPITGVEPEIVNIEPRS